MLQIRSSQFLGQQSEVRVDLLDHTGRRFTIYENQGRPDFRDRKVVRLPIRDFHLFGWGKVHPGALEPRHIREIQLRPRFIRPLNEPVIFQINLLVPARDSGTGKEVPGQ